MIGPFSIVLAAAVLMATAGSETPQPFRPGHKGVTYPQVLKAPLPVYPMAAARIDVEATIRVGFVVSSEGFVDQVQILEATLGEESMKAAADVPGRVTTSEFEEAVRKAISRRRYAPAMRQGRPVAVSMETTVVFSSEEWENLRRWQQVEKGLHALADASVIPVDADVAGRNGVSYPLAIKRRSPSQPHGARLRGVHSRVALLLLVDEDGSVTDIPLMRAEQPGLGFADAAAKAVRRWRFAPARKNGQAVAAYHWLEVSIPSQ
ncbi:MAG: energy transducer TonB [Acidobacteria bacterium]|nr:energy transducer TonB [Acidobacteriota bacterium]